MRPALLSMLLLLLALPATSAHAERTQVFSLRGADCGDCGKEAIATIKKLKGVKSARFDLYKVELSVTMADHLSDSQVAEFIQKSNGEFTVIPGPGQGAYLPPVKYPDGADVAVLTQDGSAVGPLEKLRVTGKYTIFDVYADWCGPCRALDVDLRAAAGARPDVAVRKLNVVRFDSPLAQELGGGLTSLPYVIVFTPEGKRHDFTGRDFKKIAAVLGGT